jgi:rhodanese-related sulfurtransferase
VLSSASTSRLLDVREPGEYALGHIPGAINLPQADLATRLEDIPRDRTVLTICRSGYRSLRAAQFLKQMRYDAVMSVQGGMEAWERSGRQIVCGGVGSERRRIVETEWMHAGGAPLAATA